MDRNLLENITTVEISTVIVDEIVDEVFIPWEVYQTIFSISRRGLEQSETGLSTDLSLRDRYLQLRRQLEVAYCLQLIDPNSSLYVRSLTAKIKRDLPVLSQNNSQWESIATRLPAPLATGRRQNMSKVNKLLNDRTFVNILHQLGKSKAALDRRNAILASSNSCREENLTDTTYAQTSLQLDGKIVNRYAQAILEHRDRHLLLKLHEQSTSAGEQQWRGLIKFMLSFVER